jgi:hypothetical protein
MTVIWINEEFSMRKIKSLCVALTFAVAFIGFNSCEVDVQELFDTSEYYKTLANMTLEGVGNEAGSLTGIISDSLVFPLTGGEDSKPEGSGIKYSSPQVPRASIVFGLYDYDLYLPVQDLVKIDPATTTTVQVKVEGACMDPVTGERFFSDSFKTIEVGPGLWNTDNIKTLHSIAGSLTNIGGGGTINASEVEIGAGSVGTLTWGASEAAYIVINSGGTLGGNLTAVDTGTATSFAAPGSFSLCTFEGGTLGIKDAGSGSTETATGTPLLVTFAGSNKTTISQTSQYGPIKYELPEFGVLVTVYRDSPVTPEEDVQVDNDNESGGEVQQP